MNQRDFSIKFVQNTFEYLSYTKLVVFYGEIPGKTYLLCPKKCAI